MGTKTYYQVLTYNTSTDYSLATVSMPTNQTLTMGYDGLRRLKSVNGGLYNLSYTYRDRDATYTTTQVSRLSYTRSGATTLNFDYTYDTLGNIKTYKAPSKTTITYTYDNQGQLTKAAGATTYTYTYDNVGNILTASNGTKTHTYTYGDTNWGDLLMKFDGQSISYDGAGNPTSYYNGTRWTFGWSNGRNLTSASGGGKTLSFTYDLQDGTRSTKTVGSEVHNYIYAGGKLLRETYGNTKLDFIYDVNGRPYAMIVNETTTYYYITNLQGDVINVVNSSGTTVASYEYDPYGYPVVEDETALGFTNPLRYRGYYWDAETKLYYLQSRYYDPAVGRFINCDIAFDTDAGLQGYNLFSYCGNNPICRVDTGGADSERIEDLDLADHEVSLFGGGFAGHFSAPPPSRGNFWLELFDMLSQAFKDGIGGLSGYFRSSFSSAGTFLPEDYYINKQAPKFYTPDSEYTNWKYNSYTKEYEYSTAYYDYAGRQVVRVDWTNHGRSDHTNPHVHFTLYDGTYRDGVDIRRLKGR